jgi:hypothetical protein
MKFKETKSITAICFFIVLIISLNACKKEEPLNPFVQNTIEDTTTMFALDPKSIEGLYQNVFKPNCTTSGCHDGTFPPDFRNIESTYNSLVWGNIVSNTIPAKDFLVTPGNHANSILIDRLTTFVANTSGQMPLEILPESDYSDKKDEYIQDIKDWINDGAKDVFGNSAITINLRPQLNGFYITETGNTSIFIRNVKGVIKVPASATNIDLYFAISDKETSANALTINKLLCSISRDDFSQAAEYAMNIIPVINEIGYLGLNTEYYHKVSISNIDLLWPIDQRVFIKTIVNDGTNPDSDLPGLNTLEHLKNFYSFERTL